MTRSQWNRRQWIHNMGAASAGLAATGWSGLALAQKSLSVGFIYVGPRDDYGYNQAHAEAVAAVKKLGGLKVWPVGSSFLKAETYGWLKLDRPTEESGDPFPAGYVHLPVHAAGIAFVAAGPLDRRPPPRGAAARPARGGDDVAGEVRAGSLGAPADSRGRA